MDLAAQVLTSFGPVARGACNFHCHQLCNRSIFLNTVTSVGDFHHIVLIYFLTKGFDKLHRDTRVKQKPLLLDHACKAYESIHTHDMVLNVSS